MIKKILLIILCLLLALSTCVSAETETSNAAETAEMSVPGDRPGGGMRGPGGGEMPQGERPQVPGGEMNPPAEGTVAENGQAQNEENVTAGQNFERPQGGMWRMPGGMGQMNGNWNPEADRTTEQTWSELTLSGFVQTYSTPITAMILLVMAFVFVILYKRKNY